MVNANLTDLPTVSIIIPCYNARATLGRCLHCVFESEFSSYEVIVVDDHSTDGSLETVDGLPCKVVRLEQNLGAAAARNRGAERARGELLFFLDSDVLVERNTLRQIVESFTAGRKSRRCSGRTRRTPPRETSPRTTRTCCITTLIKLRAIKRPRFAAASVPSGGMSSPSTKGSTNGTGVWKTSSWVTGCTGAVARSI